MDYIIQHALCSFLDLFFFLEMQVRVYMQQLTETVPTNIIISIFIKILVCVCLRIMRFYLLALLWSSLFHRHF